MSIVYDSKLVITDSGGIQEETSYLGIPCLTLRENTERPITITHGTNKLCNIDNLEENFFKILPLSERKPSRIKFWDGNTSSRIVSDIRSSFNI